MKRTSPLPEWFEESGLNTPMLDFLLDENRSPVARMRLFSEGVNENHRILAGDQIMGDRGCMACGNCVDACPVVKDKSRFVFIQNQRTSMALENIVAEECRRCYNCIKACPQVSKPIKEYAAGFRRGEKIIHFLTAVIILSLAFSSASRIPLSFSKGSYLAKAPSFKHRRISASNNGALQGSSPILME